MSYYMRFVLTDGAPPSLAAIEQALKAADEVFTLTPDTVDANAGDLYWGEQLYGEIEINERGDPLCDEDIDDFVEELGKHDDPNRELVLRVLEQATGMVVLRVLRAGDENAMRLNHLWDWLFATRAGLLQVDEEGFFDAERRVISLL